MCLGAMAAGSLGAGGLAKYAYDQRKERKKLQQENQMKDDLLQQVKERGATAIKPKSSKPVSKTTTINTSQRQY